MKNNTWIRRIKRMGIVFASVVILLFVVTLIILPYSKGIPEPFLDEFGEVIEGSISEKVFVEINDETHGMFIKGIDKTRPVLLLLHGGPGLTDYFLAQDYPTELEKEFVVCYWEQLGTGLSYHKDLDQAEMTTQRLIDDTISVTNYLRERFNKDKIYLMGHSFGSYLGIKTIANSPDLYHAYIAMSQITNQLESEKIAYSYMLNEYITNGNKKMEKKMNEFQILNSDEDFQSYLNSNIRDLVMHDLGVGTTHDMDSVVKGLFFPSLRCKDYTQLERINIWKGKVFSRGTGLMNEVYAFNAETEIPKIDIPIYFFAGIYDYTVAYELQLSYFNNIDAPLKGFYTFNNSAHSPVFEEPDFALEILVNDVLNLTTSLQDN